MSFFWIYRNSAWISSGETDWFANVKYEASVSFKKTGYHYIQKMEIVTEKNVPQKLNIRDLVLRVLIVLRDWKFSL